VVYVQGEDGLGKVGVDGGILEFLLDVDHASEEIDETCRVWARGTCDSWFGI
jgi:hypothetical protein